jgi:glycerol-3-phosphate dehydrogenase
VARRNPPDSPPPFHRAARDERVRALPGVEFDLAVIGAGITGSAVARDAALRGLSVALLDQGDLGGASAPPVALLPAGDSAERRRLQALAPHLIPPQDVLRERRGGGGLGAWARRLRGDRGRGHEPPAGRIEGQTTKGRVVRGTRLALALARSAHDAGAWVMPWLQAEGLVLERARLRGLEVFDRLTGGSGVLRASVIVDATGPWADRTRGLRGPRPRLLEPSDRLAFVLHADLLAGGPGVHLLSGVTVLPFAGRTLVLDAGAPFEGDFDHVVPSGPRVRRVLGELADVLPSAAGAAVAGAWAGLVAAPAEDGSLPGVIEDDDGLITAIGGHADGHRALAEQTLAAVAGRLRAEGVHVGGCLTAAVPLPGGEGVRWNRGALEAMGPGAAEAQMHAREHLPPGVAEHLLATYGGRWHEVAGLAVDDPSLAEPLVPGLPLLAAQVIWSLQEDCVCSLPDLLRRLDLPLLDLEGARRLLPDLAAAAATAQGWSSADLERQLAFAGAGLDAIGGPLGL